MSKDIHFICPKCGNTTYETGEIRTTGGFLSKIFDVQNKDSHMSPASAANTLNYIRLTAACLEIFSICLHRN